MDRREGNHRSERWSLAVAPRGGARASCGRAAGGLRSGARISQAKLIPPRHAGRPPARGCAVLGRAAVSSPLRPLRHGVPCGAGSPASSTPLTCQLSSSSGARRGARRRSQDTGDLSVATCAGGEVHGPSPASRGPRAQPYSGLGCQLPGGRRTADSSSLLVLQPVRFAQRLWQAQATLAPPESQRRNGLGLCTPSGPEQSATRVPCAPAA